jgi:hypothetical protein
VCLSVRPRGIAWLPLDEFSWKLIFEFFSKVCQETSSFIQIWEEQVLYMTTNISFFIVPRSFLRRMRCVSDKSCSKNENTHFMFSNLFFRISCSLWENMEKDRRAGQATDGNMAHTHFILDTKGYKHTLTICNTYCFSTATMVARTLLSVTWYIPYLPYRGADKSLARPTSRCILFDG